MPSLLADKKPTGTPTDPTLWRNAPPTPRGPDLVEQHNTGNTYLDDMYNMQKDQVPDYLKYQMSESNHLPWQRYLNNDVATADLNRYSSGQDDADLSRGLDKPADLGGGDTSTTMGKAIQAKYASQVGDKMQGLKSNWETTQKSADQLSKASTMLGQSEAIRMQNFKEQYQYQQKRRELYNQWKNAQDQATAGFISSVLSTVGTVGGAIAGGIVAGPAGAAAGAAAGGGGGGHVPTLTQPLT